MAVFKCKMCGGSLEVTEGATVCECEYCGTKQTLPKSGDDATSRLFNRANHLRMKCEFDKAQEIYEKIVSTQTDDAEAYWGLVLCKFGIEYVEDPGTFRKIPTCHRTQLDSILADMDYQSALKYADPAQKELYEAEAKEIDRLQKNILDIVRKEKPFDVFICYKETDEDGKRTQDSVIANDIYYQLTQEGFKVFYAAITLEDKLGQEYEPYIFAALSSARVMLVIGTKPEYFSAVWVRNEWSRFLKLMKQDRKKQLIPCYRDMDAYDMPEEFSHLQAQDMSKIGFINDLVRGIRKLTQNETEKPVVQKTIVTGNASTAPLLKRISLFLEDGDWNSAKEYCEKVLDIDPECSQAYCDLLLVKLRKHTITELENSAIMKGIAEDDDFKKAVRFADAKTREQLEHIHLQTIYHYAENLLNAAKTDLDYDKAKQVYESIRSYKDAAEKIKACERGALEYFYQLAEEKLGAAKTDTDYMAVKQVYSEISSYKDSAAKVKLCEEKALEYRYQQAKLKLEQAKTESECQLAGKLFKELGIYKDAKKQVEKCSEKAEKIRKDHIYDSAWIIYDRTSSTVDALNDAIELFQSISGWKDSDELIKKSRERIKIIEEEERKNKLAAEKMKRRKKIKCIILSIIAGVIFIAFIIGLITYNCHKFEMKLDKIKTSEMGDLVQFGKREWYVIEKSTDSCTLLCNDVIDEPYNNQKCDVTWETCSLRTYLNDSFYNEFSTREKEVIVKKECVNKGNEKTGISGGNNTEDYVYILSYDEAKKIDKSILDCDIFWWLRTPGERAFRVLGVDGDGDIDEYHGYYVISGAPARVTRPVITIDLSK